MDCLITIFCYKNSEIIDGPYGVGYSCPPDRGVLVNNTITYDELEDKLCHVMSIDRAHTKLSMVFRYPILMPIGNRNINYVQLPIKDGDDVQLMFHAVAKIPPSNTTECTCRHVQWITHVDQVYHLMKRMLLMIWRY